MKRLEGQFLLEDVTVGDVMMGDHTVLSVFLDLVPIGVPIPFYILGLFVCFVQAFVFTLLSINNCINSTFDSNEPVFTQLSNLIGGFPLPS